MLACVARSPTLWFANLEATHARMTAAEQVKTYTTLAMLDRNIGYAHSKPLHL